jgi:hypothetical protein
MATPIREIINMPFEEVWALREGLHSVQFEDQKTPTQATRRRLILTWIFCRPHREFPEPPIPLSHYFSERRFTKRVDVKVMERIFWDIYNHYEAIGKDSQQLFEDLSLCVYRTINDLHNFTVSRLSEYISSLSLIDLIEIHNHPEISAIKQRAVKQLTSDNPEADVITKAYKEILNILRSDAPELRHNNLAKMIRSGVPKMNQVSQLIGPRGYVTSIAGDVFLRPITNGYMDGLNGLEDLLIDSQSASIALYRTHADLSNNEYFNRRMQLLTSIIEGIRGEDCGTDKPMEWHVSKEDLEVMEGKYYYEKKGGPLAYIRKTDTHLIGKRIYVRTLLTCKNENPRYVCKTCMGKAWRVMNSGTTLGLYTTSDLISEISQLMLSAKHVISSSSAIKLDLKGKNAVWLKPDKENDFTIQVSNTSPSEHFVLKVFLKEVFGLTTLQNAEEVEDIPPKKISDISEFFLAPANEKGEVIGPYETQPCVIEGMRSSLATDVNVAIKNGQFTIDGEMMEIFLKNFRGKKLLETPMRSEDIGIYAKSIWDFLLGADRSDSGRAAVKHDCIAAYSSAPQALHALLSLLRQQLNVSFLQVEFFVRACMTRDARSGDYSLPRGGEPFTFAKASDILLYRTPSTGMLFQYQKSMFFNPAAYNHRTQHDHIMDVIFR